MNTTFGSLLCGAILIGGLAGCGGGDSGAAQNGGRDGGAPDTAGAAGRTGGGGTAGMAATGGAGGTSGRVDAGAADLAVGTGGASPDASADAPFIDVDAASSGGRNGQAGAGGDAGGTAVAGANGGGGIGGGGGGGTAGAGGGSSSCGAENAACGSAANAGLCRSNACAACVDVTDDQICQAAYGSDHLCLAGSCAIGRCRDNSGCASGQICNANQCQACADVTDDVRCGAGKLCINTACTVATCRANTDCGAGLLCQANQCRACAEPSDDGACAVRYGAGSICNAGTCATGCRTASDCAGGQLCKNKVCSSCATGDDSSCAARYGNTSVCVGSLCAVGGCSTDTGCGGATLCENAACSPCVDQTDDTRCQTRYGAGKLCVGGSCVVADCRADASCTGGQLCKSNTCATCTDVTDDGVCAARYGGGFICNAGTCRAGCRADSTCGSGQLCKSNTCAACADVTDDGVCAARYGATFICNAGVCRAGCRSDDGCAAGTLCKALVCAACADPTDDASCSTRYGAESICRAGACQTGCRTAGGCSGADAGKLCTALLCAACTQNSGGDASCTTQYAQQSVCVGGACLPGNCRTSADCAGANAGFRCVNNQCTPCANDGGCQGDPTYGATFICHTAATNGAGGQGQCVTNSCTTARAVCPANPNVDFCCAGASGNTCFSGTCCVTADCAFGQTCTSHQCIQCNTVADGNYYVDPANGTDTAGVTGSSTCAWKTITYALAQLASNTQPATINVKATADVGTSSGETMPIGISTALPNAGGTFRVVPSKRTIRGAGSDVPTIKMATNQVAFILANPTVVLSQLVVDSVDTTQANRGLYGIRVFQGSDASTSIDHVTVRNTSAAAIRVERSVATSATSGVLTIGSGVTITGAGTSACGGLHVVGNGAVTVTGGTGNHVTQFINNNGYGICVGERGQVTLTGSAVFPVAAGQAEGTIIIKGNTSGGLSIAQCISDANVYVPINGGSTPPPAFTRGNCPAALAGLGTAPPSNTLTGIAVWNHATGTANGIFSTAGSRIRLRNSVVLGNARAGFRVDNGPTYTPTANNNYRVFDLTGIDLGTAASPGANVLQVPWGAASPLNGGAGIQVNITASQAQTLIAVGNRLQDDATSGVQVDCGSTTTAVSRNYPNVATCFTTSTKGISVCGNINTATTPNRLDVSTCTIP